MLKLLSLVINNEYSETFVAGWTTKTVFLKQQTTLISTFFLAKYSVVKAKYTVVRILNWQF